MPSVGTVMSCLASTLVGDDFVFTLRVSPVQAVYLLEQDFDKLVICKDYNRK